MEIGACVSREQTPRELGMQKLPKEAETEAGFRTFSQGGGHVLFENVVEIVDVLADEDCTEDFKLEARREQKAARFTQHVVDLVAQGYTPLIAVEKALAADPSLSFFLGSDTMQEMLKRAGSLSAPGLEWGQVGTDTPE
jgi:hypothetical protein